MNEIELTQEQKDCVEYPLNERILIIDADPGTGKTEILRHRVKFIHQQNEKRRKFILVLAVGKNISLSIKRKLKEAGLKKIHHSLRSVIPEFSHRIPPCDDTDCPKCQEHNQPIILTSTVHSLAYWMIRQLFAKKFQEKRKIHVLTNAYKKDLSLLYQNNNFPKINEKIHWTTQEIITRKRRIFSFLINQITKEKLTKETKKELWDIFRQEIEIERESEPYYHWSINGYEDFLARIEGFYPDNELNLYSELLAICQENQTKNIWLSFEDMIENVLLFGNRPDTPTNWPAFDYILVDECQDLKRNLLTLITEIFSHKEANFTFVGDPKQNIMAFAGATDDIFQLLKEKFPDCVQKEISISFRVPEEIAVMANDFTRKFMSRRKPKLATNKTNGGKNPVVFLAGSEQGYQLTEEEENKIEEKLKSIPWEKEESEIKKNRKTEKLRSKLIKEEIWTKKLRRQVEFILSIINQLDKSFSRVILYRKNEIGNWLKNWFIETNNHDFVVVGDNQNRLVKFVINKIRDEIKNRPFSLSSFNSMEDFLIHLKINWKSIYKFQQIIEKFDQERLLDEERAETGLTEEEIYEFTRQIDKQLIERNIENAGKTRLSSIHKAKGLEFDYVFLIAVDEETLPSENPLEWEEVNLFYTAITRTKKELYLTASCWDECSRYLKCLDRNLIELLPTDLSQITASYHSSNHQHSNPTRSIAEIMGDEGEKKVFEFLANNKKIKWEKLVRNWQEIEGLQIDIYGETKEKVYFIEVKNWSEAFYYSPTENFHHQQKIWDQQITRQEKIAEDFNSSKKIVYLVSFPTGELANDFKLFLNQKGTIELLAAHHDKVHTKTWKTEYNILRVDESIAEKEK
ncbi:Putative ATP-dependent DNA helicase UvrD/PcrA [endosymbiont DhMRE of Dentiscutata heterogama]|nr:UvrD-helicase domain-containing protein [endosymbiont DhMRE of Dentiscutata heterogama]CFW93123.1 Putative ATP-dependent DNA helicase UvrD/PcrA [endosymbiont DhMRE of Dentiscutata heterogama]